MKLMRSTKTGSTCSDCGQLIKVGDPIAFFGIRAIYGLQCHSNEKTRKHLANLLQQEANGGGTPTQSIEYQRPPGLQANVATATLPPPVDPATQQEWVVRITWSPNIATEHAPDLPMFEWLLQARYCGQLSVALNVIEFRAPRNIATPMTKGWAERAAAEWQKQLQHIAIAEAAPLWVE